MSDTTQEGSASMIRILVRVVLIAAVAYGAWAIARDYLSRDDRQRDIALAYEFAVDNPEVMSHLPCFCGCGKREGHGSLDSCFVSRRDEEGRMVSRDPHAETCRICIDVALTARRMRAEGANIAAIRSAVDTEYGDVQGLSTNTPMPAHDLH